MSPGAESLAGVEAGTVGGDDEAQEYVELRRRIVRDIVPRHTPRRAVIAVVSKGDADLVRLEDREGWHFPRGSTGQYAGYHPRDGEHALEHLESLRSQGADYLLIPGPYLWWLDHYPELREHLEANCRLVNRGEDACLIFYLGDAPETAAAPGALPGRGVAASPTSPEPASLAGPLRLLLDSLLPKEEPVLVAADEAPELLDLGREALHFPSEQGGRPTGLDPSDGFMAVAGLHRASERGLRYLVVPRHSFWKVEQSRELRHYLRRHCRLVAIRGDVAALFEIETEPQGTAPSASMLRDGAGDEGEAQVPRWLAATRRLLRGTWKDGGLDA